MTQTPKNPDQRRLGHKRFRFLSIVGSLFSSPPKKARRTQNGHPCSCKRRRRRHPVTDCNVQFAAASSASNAGTTRQGATR